MSNARHYPDPSDSPDFYEPPGQERKCFHLIDRRSLDERADEEYERQQERAVYPIKDEK